MVFGLLCFSLKALSQILVMEVAATGASQEVSGQRSQMYSLMFGWSSVEPGVGLDDPSGPFQPRLFCDSMIHLLEQDAQGRGGVTIPEVVQETWRCGTGGRG